MPVLEQIQTERHQPPRKWMVPADITAGAAKKAENGLLQGIMQ